MQSVSLHRFKQVEHGFINRQAACMFLEFPPYLYTCNTLEKGFEKELEWERQKYTLIPE